MGFFGVLGSVSPLLGALLGVALPGVPRPLLPLPAPPAAAAAAASPARVLLSAPRPGCVFATAARQGRTRPAETGESAPPPSPPVFAISPHSPTFLGRLARAAPGGLWVWYCPEACCAGSDSGATARVKAREDGRDALLVLVPARLFGDERAAILAILRALADAGIVPPPLG